MKYTSAIAAATWLMLSAVSLAQPLPEQQAQPRPDREMTEPGYLGAITDDRQRAPGVRILEVIRDGPADRAGLARNDLITEVDGQRVRNIEEMARLLKEATAGTEVRFTVLRGGALDGKGEEAQVVVNLAQRPPPGARPFPNFGRIGGEQADGDAPPDKRPALLGVQTVTLDAGWRRELQVPVAQGAVVVRVFPDSPAAAADLARGEVIVGVDGLVVRSSDELTERIQAAGPAASIELLTYRGNRPETRSIRLSGGRDTTVEAMAEEIRQLKGRVQQLEARLNRLEQHLNRPSEEEDGENR